MPHIQGNACSELGFRIALSLVPVQEASAWFRNRTILKRQIRATHLELSNTMAASAFLKGKITQLGPSQISTVPRNKNTRLRNKGESWEALWRLSHQADDNWFSLALPPKPYHSLPCQNKSTFCVTGSIKTPSPFCNCMLI